MHDHRPPPAGHGNGAPRTKWVFIAFAALAAFFLLAEHRAHVLGLLPWLFLLACPLMHLFMHHGHGHHGGHDHGSRASEAEKKKF
ncbi:DUF2933 domain-containing protein [Pseudothauera rhizosphaerae]|uniref:DUF2933 domain-containing protein n=2 Tax=Pseudothauera rhizosphaerae TaxID=2565932 RepID=A0A4S4AWP3_9RHOO|nr:DUF2933 domain-containing protein [Pseudothauera rhizosphaerae]